MSDAQSTDVSRHSRPVSGREALAMALGAIVVLQLTLPPTRWPIGLLLALSLVLAAVALWTGRRAWRRARRAGEHAPGAVPATLIGAFTFFLAFASAFSYAAVPEMRELNGCLQGANTEAARAACWEAIPRPEWPPPPR